MQVTVNMDKLQEQKDNVAAFQRESAAALAAHETATARLRAELTSLADRLEATMNQLLSSRRQEQVLATKLRDADARILVPSCLLVCCLCLLLCGCMRTKPGCMAQVVFRSNVKRPAQRFTHEHAWLQTRMLLQKGESSLANAETACSGLRERIAHLEKHAKQQEAAVTKASQSLKVRSRSIPLRCSHTCLLLSVCP